MGSGEPHAPLLPFAKSLISKCPHLSLQNMSPLLDPWIDLSPWLAARQKTIQCSYNACELQNCRAPVLHEKAAET